MRGGARQRYLASAPAVRDRSRSPRRAPSRRGAGARRAALAAQETCTDPDAVGARFRTYVSKLHLSNKLSALETQCLASNAAGAGATGVTDIASVGASGLHPGNAHRDLMRRYLKGCSVPEVYVAEIPIHDPQSDTDHVPVMLPFLLPHEMIHCILKGSARTADDLAQLPEGGPLDNVATVFAHDKGVERNRVLPIGFHGDGVPHKKTNPCRYFRGTFYF